MQLRHNWLCLQTSQLLRLSGVKGLSLRTSASPALNRCNDCPAGSHRYIRSHIVVGSLLRSELTGIIPPLPMCLLFPVSGRSLAHFNITVVQQWEQNKVFFSSLTPLAFISMEDDILLFLSWLEQGQQPEKQGNMNLVLQSLNMQINAVLWSVLKMQEENRYIVCYGQH